MQQHPGSTRSAAWIVASLLLIVTSGARGGSIDGQLRAAVNNANPSAETAIIIHLADRVRPAAISKQARPQRAAALVRALRHKAATSQAELRAALQRHSARRVQSLWVINAIAARVGANQIDKLAAMPGVDHISLDAVLSAPVAGSAAATIPEWNLSAIHATTLWSLGFNGSGTVVATLDTGVDALHPDLSAGWRGGTNSWFDPYGQHTTPHDSNGHGTQTLGILIGGGAGGTAIGVAPGAQWIAAKIFDDSGKATFSNIHLAFQWLLDPDGDSETRDAPNVVNASWGFEQTTAQCMLEFADDILALKAADIAVVFAAGNSGPDTGSNISPANNPGAFAAGALDNTLTVAGFSARGPSACDGGVFPLLTAPGVGINTADLSFGGLPLYTTVSGTSFAAPHLAGAMALLLGAIPGAGVDTVEQVLLSTAHDLGDNGPDNAYGHGLVDVLAAYNQLTSTMTNQPPVITSIPVTTATENLAYRYSMRVMDENSGALTYALETAPPEMSIDESGLIDWIPGATQVGDHAVTVHVQDSGGLFAEQSYVVRVSEANAAPVAVNNWAITTRNQAKTIAVLKNDYDPDGSLNVGSVKIVAAPVHGGKVVVKANGTVKFIPKWNYVGKDSFRYKVKDNLGMYSNAATVKVNVAH